MQQHQIAEIVRKKMPNAEADAVDRSARDFLQRLRESSPIAAERLSKGGMADAELASRIDVFLNENAVAASRRASVTGTPRDRVAEALKKEPGIASSDSERKALADRFIEQLGALSRSARESLLSGTLPPDELQSRVKVFADDLRTQASRVATDPAVASAAPIVEAYIKANYGSATERPGGICFRGVVEQGAAKPEFVIFKKRPNKLRIHTMKDGLVIGVIGYDGSSAWRQTPGKMPQTAKGAAVEAIAQMARFDDALIGLSERRAEVRIEEKPASGPVRLRIREADGSVSLSTIDPKTNRQISLRRLGPNGHWSESRFSDYRKVGTISLPYVVEEWNSGVLKSTTRISSISLNPGLLDRFFSIPVDPSLDFMDYMRALAILKERAKPSVASQAAASLPK